MWPNCLGAVRKAGIMSPHQLVVGGGDCDGGGAGAAVLSTFYVLINASKVTGNKSQDLVLVIV